MSQIKNGDFSIQKTEEDRLSYFYKKCTEIIRDWEPRKKLQELFLQMRKENLEPAKLWRRFSQSKQTLFYYSMIHCSFETTQLLIDEGMDPEVIIETTPSLNFGNPHESYRTHALWVALAYGEKEVAELIFDEVLRKNKGQTWFFNLTRSIFYHNFENVLIIKNQEDPYLFIARFCLDIEAKKREEGGCFIYEMSRRLFTNPLDKILFDKTIETERALREKQSLDHKLDKSFENSKIVRL